MSYVGSLGRHLVWRRNLNAIPTGANFLPANADATVTGKPLPPAFLRPMAGYNDVHLIEEASSSNYHSLQASARRRFARRMQFGASWTWSKTLDYNDGERTDQAGADVSVLVPPRVWNYGLASFDRTHVLTIHYLYELPRTRVSFLPARMLLNGWQVSGITRFISGSPSGINLTTTNAADITGTPSEDARAVVSGNPVLPKGERTFDRYFRTEVFALPAKGTFGNAAKTVIREPGINNWDVSIFKNFPVREGVSGQFRCEMYNAFNHTQFSNVNVTARFNPAGEQTNAAFGQINGARRPRYIQLALRFRF